MLRDETDAELETRVQTAGYYQESKFGLLFGCNDRFKITPYSLFLADCISEENFIHKRICDFGCGTGVIGLAVAAGAECEVIGLDIEQESLQLSEANREINRIRNISFYENEDYKLSVFNSSSIEENQFDYILSNPASLPVPDNLPGLSFSNGGNDGSAMIRELILFASTDLKVGGQLLFLHTSLTSITRTLEFLDSMNFEVTIEYVLQLEFRESYDQLVEHILKLRDQDSAFFFENSSSKYELIYFIRALKK